MLRKIIVLLLVFGAMVSDDAGCMIARNICLGLIGASLIFILAYYAAPDKEEISLN